MRGEKKRQMRLDEINSPERIAKRKEIDKKLMAWQEKNKGK